MTDSQSLDDVPVLGSRVRSYDDAGRHRSVSLEPIPVQSEASVQQISERRAELVRLHKALQARIEDQRKRIEALSGDSGPGTSDAIVLSPSATGTTSP